MSHATSANRDHPSAGETLLQNIIHAKYIWAIMAGPVIDQQPCTATALAVTVVLAAICRPAAGSSAPLHGDGLAAARVPRGTHLTMCPRLFSQRLPLPTESASAAKTIRGQLVRARPARSPT